MSVCMSFLLLIFLSTLPNIYQVFGDCDCSRSTPLVSLDVVSYAKQISPAHFLAFHSVLTLDELCCFHTGGT